MAGHDSLPASTGGPQEADPLKAFLRRQPNVARELIAGGMAGALAKTCVAPLERAKILFQTRRLGNLGIPRILMHVWKTEGVPGLFRGNSASVLRIVPYAAIHFSAYEHYRRILVSHVVGHEGSSSTASHSAKLHPIWDLVAGSAAGGTAVVLTYPLDLVRTRMAWVADPIAQPGTISPPANTGSQSHSSSHKLGTTTHQTASGSSALSPGLAQSGSSWCGHTVPQHGVVPARPGVACTLHSSSQSNQAGATSVSSSSGQHTTRLYSSTSHVPHPGLRSLLAQTVRQEGVTGLYKGMSPTLMGILPYAGLKFYVYQSLKGSYKSHLQQQQSAQGEGGSAAQDVSVQVRLLFGGVAGLVSQTITYPLDVIRRRMQVEGLTLDSGQGGSSSRVSRSSTWSTARSIISEEGLKGLIRGLAINNIKVIPSTAIGFTVYDYLKQYMDVKGNL